MRQNSQSCRNGMLLLGNGARGSCDRLFLFDNFLGFHDNRSKTVVVVKKILHIKTKVNVKNMTM